MERSPLWQYAALGRTPAWLVALGACAILLYALAKLHFKSVSGAAEPLFLLAGFWCIYRYGGGIGRDRVFWLLAGAVSIPLVSWGWSQFAHPQLAEPYPHLDRLARGFLFIAIAWWLAGSTRNTLLFWTVAAAGVLLSPWLSGGGWQELSAGLQGTRVDFNLRNAQHTSLFFGTVLIGLVALHRRFLAPRKWAWPLRGVWLLALALALTVIFLTQTRAAWLALLAALLPMIGYGLIHYRHQAAQPRVWVPALIGLALVGLVLYSPLEAIVVERLDAEPETLELLARGDFDQLPYSSIGIRIHIWRAGLEFIAQQPLFGWGGNGRSLVFELTSWLAVEELRGFGHLHNSYIDMMVNYGLVGLLFYCVLLGWLLRRAYASYRARRMPRDVFLFFVAFITFWTVMNVFESYFFFWTGLFVFNVVCAGILTHIWKPAFDKLEKAG